MKYLAIGDSLTAERAGIQVYAQKLATSLPALGFTGAYSTGYQISGASVVNHGHGGWATQGYAAQPSFGFLERWQTEALDEHADVVSIMIAGNDSAKDPPAYSGVRVSLENYTYNLNYFISSLIAQNPAVKIILMTPTILVTNIPATPPVAELSNALLKTYCDAAASVAATRGLPLVDNWTTMWELCGHSEANFLANYCYAGDLTYPQPYGVHLNQAGQDIVYTGLLAAIETALNPPVVDNPYDTIPYLYTGSGMQVGGYGITSTATRYGVSRGRTLTGLSRGRISCGY